MNVLSLFDGISCAQIALNRVGIPYDKYFASEIDEYAVKVTQDNYPDTIQLGDVLDVKSEDLPTIDIIFAGSPCQGFSRAGNRLNFDDPRSKLFFEFIRLLEETNPRYFFLENTHMQQEYQEVISRYLGVKPLDINSSLVSAQNRRRLYWTNIPNEGLPKDKGLMLKSIIGDYRAIDVYPRGNNPGGEYFYKGKSPTVTTSNWRSNFHIVRKDGTKEKFEPEHTEALQTIPIGYTSSVSMTRRIGLCGNAWTVDVICHLIKNLKEEN